MGRPPVTVRGPCTVALTSEDSGMLDAGIQPPLGIRPRPGATAIAAAIGCGIVAALSIQEYFTRHWGGGPRNYATILFAQAIGAAVWLAFIPLIIRPVTRRVPLSGGGIVRHALIVGGVAVVHTLIVATLFASYYYPGSLLAIRDVFRDRMHTVFAWSVVIYLILAGLLSWQRAAIPAPPTEPAASAPDMFEGEQRASTPLRRVLVRNEGRVVPVSADQIDWLEAADNHVIIHAGTMAHKVRGSLNGFADRLDPTAFVRVHRGAIVNVNRIREVQTWFHGELVAILKDDTRVTVGRTYRDGFMAVLEG